MDQGPFHCTLRRIISISHKVFYKQRYSVANPYQILEWFTLNLPDPYKYGTQQHVKPWFHALQLHPGCTFHLRPTHFPRTRVVVGKFSCNSHFHTSHGNSHFHAVARRSSAHSHVFAGHRKSAFLFYDPTHFYWLICIYRSFSGWDVHLNTIIWTSIGKLCSSLFVYMETNFNDTQNIKHCTQGNRDENGLFKAMANIVVTSKYK